MISTRLIGLAAVAWLAAAVPASFGQSGRKLTADELEQAYTLAKQIQDGKRLREALADVRSHFVGSGVVSETAVSEALTLLEEVRYERRAEERATAKVASDAALARVANELIDDFPPADAIDNPNDDGTKLLVLWKPVPGAENYRIERRDTNPDGSEREPWHPHSMVKGGAAYSFLDEEHIRSGRQYFYRVTALDAEGEPLAVSETTSPGVPQATWFDFNKLWFLVLVVAPITFFVMYYIQLAKSGVRLTIRKLAGLDAVDEAVGRATEMGRPILFVPGIQDMNDIQTVAGLIVLGRVARTAAERDANLEVPTCRSLVMTAAREMVQNAYMEVGRPDAFDEKKIYYTTDEQFGYVAAVTGTMVREAPATCFYMGSFFAESLILAETANMMGSIQIAGTAQPSQLPFFVAACDYTLLGEELFAASAYLSGEPQQLGSLKGQDMGKLLAGTLICVGVLLVSVVTLLEDDFGPLGAWRDWLIDGVLRTAE